MFKVNNIEDCLETLVYSPEFVLEKSDINILTSIARQLKKKTALTDRQYSLVRTKLIEYTNQFTQNSIDLSMYLNELRMPLREIDRSHWLIKEDDLLKIRFPFSKKIIDRIEELRRIDPKVHGYKEHVHTFPFSETYLFKLMNVVKKFEHKFTVDEQLLDMYNQLSIINESKDNYIPGVYDYQIKNLPEKAINYLEKDCGNIYDNLALYYDRRFLYGLHIFDEDEVEKKLFNYTPLTTKIIKRELPNVFVSSRKYNLYNLVDTISEIKRFPIVIILDNDSLHMLEEFYEAVNGIIPAKQQSVLFRLDNIDEPGKDFNQYIKSKKLNNIVDNDTKIVYIKDTKVPKPLVQSDFKPAMTISFARLGPASKSKAYVENYDLLIHYYNEMGMIDRYASKNFEII